jgi:membrane protein DedA with SNARE-associated domain
MCCFDVTVSTALPHPSSFAVTNRAAVLLLGMGQLNIGLLFAVFMTSAVLGDAVNYAIGSKLGGCLERPLQLQVHLGFAVPEQQFLNRTP